MIRITRATLTDAIKVEITDENQRVVSSRSYDEDGYNIYNAFCNTTVFTRGRGNIGILIALPKLENKYQASRIFMSRGSATTNIAANGVGLTVDKQNNELLVINQREGKRHGLYREWNDTGYQLGLLAEGDDITQQVVATLGNIPREITPEINTVIVLATGFSIL